MALIGLAHGNNLTRFELAATTKGGSFSPGLNIMWPVSFSGKKGEMGRVFRLLSRNSTDCFKAGLEL